MEYTRKLAVFTPCTHKEYLRGVQDDTITKYLEKIPSQQFSFDFIFIYNKFKDEDEYEDLKIYEDHENINSIRIFNLDIDPKLDIYNDIYKKDPKPDPLPPLGGSSGPNLSFYNSFKLLKKEDYKYFLMLENDSFPCKDFWFDICFDYCDNNDFSIAGSKYKGHQKWHYVLDYKDHMNGIALYKNSPELHNILQKSEKFHETQINDKDWFLNFDIAIDRFRRSDEGEQLIKDESKFIDTEIISNVSDSLDSYLTVENILERYPKTIIIHQKDHSPKDFKCCGEDLDLKRVVEKPVHVPHPQKKPFNPIYIFRPGRIPVFLHNPRCGGTYIMAWNQILFNQYCRNKRYPLLKFGEKINLKSRRIIAEFDDKKEIHIFCYSHKDLHMTEKSFSENAISYQKSSKKFKAKQDPYINRIHIDKLMPLMNNDNFEIFSIVIPALGGEIDQRELILKSQEICKKCNSVPYFYTSTRDPFQKLESIHKQKNKENSSEETFINFVKSNELPDSWIIRALTGVKNNQEVEEPHYLEAKKHLDNFIAKDIYELDELIDEVFGHCLQLDTKNCKSRPIETSLNKSCGDLFITEYDLQDIPWDYNEKISLLDIVQGRIYYEKKIYENLTGGV